METQEQILKEQRLKIETLRYRILLRYYELLLTLDVMTQPNEVKTLMGYINTLERYAKKYETKPVKKKSGKRKEHIDENDVGTVNGNRDGFEQQGCLRISCSGDAVEYDIGY